MPDLVSELLSMAEAEQALAAEAEQALAVEVEQALAVEDVALEHSLVMCPVLLQKRQRFCSKQRCCSACMSLLSFLSFKDVIKLF